jgi:hypothetical protein
MIHGDACFAYFNKIWGIPSCLALVSLLALLGVMTLGGVIYVLGTVRGHRPQWPSVEPANRPTR